MDEAIFRFVHMQYAEALADPVSREIVERCRRRAIPVSKYFTPQIIFALDSQAEEPVHSCPRRLGHPEADPSGARACPVEAFSATCQTAPA